jgi:putative cell wall-binding protein
MQALLAAAAALVLALAALPLAPPAGGGNHAERTDRAPEPGERPDERPVEGSERYETAAQAATDAFDESEAVVLATGEDFADALAGSTLGGALDAPVLLTPGDLIDGELPDSVTDAIDELGADTAVLLGGEGAISERIAGYLEQVADMEAVERVEGRSRYETALEIARLAEEQDEGFGELPLDVETETRTAFVGTGLDFPDSVAAGPGAFASVAPVLLTAPDELHPAAETAISELDIDHVFALGGEAAVSGDVVAELEEAGVSVERLAGNDRWETAAAVADRLEEAGFEFDAEHVGLATAGEFADALASTSYLGSAEAPLVLADEGSDGELVDPAAEYLEARGCEIRTLHVLGGEGAVGPQARQQARDHAECVGGGDGEQTSDDEEGQDGAGGDPVGGAPDEEDPTEGLDESEPLVP